MRQAARLVAGALVGAGVGVALGQGAAPSLLVLAKRDEMLAVVDPVTLTVRGKVPSGGNPHEVISSPDGRTAWITNYGNGSLNTITRVDVGSRQVLGMLDLGPLHGPHGLAYAGGHVYFTAEREKLVGRLDAAGTRVEWLLGTGQTGTHMLWVAEDGTEMVTANVGAGTLSFLRRREPGPVSPAGPPSKTGATTTLGKDGPLSPDWDISVVKVGGLPEGLDVLRDEAGHARTVWVANAQEGTVSVVDFGSHAVTATLDAGVPTANRLRFTPDGLLAVVSREKSGEVTLVDVASQRVVKRVAVGTGAAGVLIAPDGARAYISCSPDNKVVVLDLKTFAVVGTIQPGTEPDGLAWAR